MSLWSLFPRHPRARKGFLVSWKARSRLFGPIGEKLRAKYFAGFYLGSAYNDEPVVAGYTGAAIVSLRSNAPKLDTVTKRLGLSRCRVNTIATGRSSQCASPTERKSMTSSAGFPSSSATGRRATWSQVSSTTDAARDAHTTTA